MTKFISTAGLATLWSCIKSTFLTKNDALATYVKKEDVATVNGASLTGGGDVQVLAVQGTTITIDASPTAGSTNAIQSASVYDINTRLTGLEDAGLVVATDFEAIETLPDAYARLNAVADQVATLTTQVETLTNKLNALITTHAVDTQSLVDDVADLQSRLSELESAHLAEVVTE